MRSLPADVKKFFARAKLAVLPEDYFVIQLPLDARPIPAEWYRPATTRFAVFIREPKEITLVVARRKWLRMRNLFPTHRTFGPMKVITFDIQIPLKLYGCVAALSRVLAKAQISIVSISAYNRDHILVAKEDLPRAVRTLREFLEGFKYQKS